MQLSVINKVSMLALYMIPKTKRLDEIADSLVSLDRVSHLLISHDEDLTD